MQTLSQVFSGAGVWPLVIGGDYFRLISSPDPVDLVFYKNGSQIANANGMDTGFYFRPVGGFDRVDITSASAQTVKIFIMDGDGGYDHFNVDIAGGVTVTGGSISVVGGVDVLQAGTIADSSAVTVGTSATLIASASASRKSLRFFNGGSVDVYIGGSGVTVAGGALKVAPGQMWVEDDGAAAAWYGVASVAGQSVRIQGVSA